MMEQLSDMNVPKGTCQPGMGWGRRQGGLQLGIACQTDRPLPTLESHDALPHRPSC